MVSNHGLAQLISGLVHPAIKHLLPSSDIQGQLLIINTLLHVSGQIIATSHDRFPPNGGLVREIPLFQGNLGW